MAIDEGQPSPRVPPAALAAALLTISLFGFGGGIVWARRIAVERRGWLGEAEFLDIVSLCQFMPGPNVIALQSASAPSCVAPPEPWRRLPASC
ncbi:MAG TPA: chromate transporter [Stellaceae bacterium]|nr:chromate transporter [Stellaceae bacterium]